MSTEYLSDREQEEALRSWWKENWSWVASGVAVGFVLLAGWNYWQRREVQNAEAAAVAHRDLTQALGANDKDKAEALLKTLDQNHSGSPYVDQAHLLMAQSHVNAGRFEAALADLKTVVDNSEDPGLAAIAKLRLARVHIQLGQHDQALALLDDKDSGAFAAQVHEIRGDALLAKGDAAAARDAYQAAIEATQKADPRRGLSGNEYLQLKLQEAAAAAPAPVAPATDKK